VVITPGDKRGENHATLRGDLVAVLDLAAGRRRSPRPEVITNALAGPGFEPMTFWSVRSQVPPRATFHTIWRPKLRSRYRGPRRRQSAALLCF
jgi:hypothetical protein